MKVDEATNYASTEVSIKLKNMITEYSIKSSPQSGTFLISALSLIDHNITDLVRALELKRCAGS